MDVQDLPLDRISNLPPNIIQTILTLMPMRYAFRTSVLSKSWRYHCLNLPTLWFGYDLRQDTAFRSLSIKCQLLHVVYPILLLHQGPILEFFLAPLDLKSCCEIDQIILHLSRNPTLKKFTLWISLGDKHKLLRAFFKLQQLEFLNLINCAFQPPVTFNGFRRLVTLSFDKVSITAEVFLRLISNCPLLKDLTLNGDEEELMGSWNLDFVELFKCLPLIEHLSLGWYPLKCFATGVMRQKLPIAPVHLKNLYFYDLSFAREFDLLSALLLVTSSPNIETILIDMYPTEVVSQTAMNIFDHQDYSYVNLDHLRVLVMTHFTIMKPGTDFMKLILAKSPMLRKVCICMDRHNDMNGEAKMLEELVQYPRASARAEIMII